MSICVMADIAGLTLTDEDRKFLLQPELAGIILFSRNYESPSQLNDLCLSIKDLRSDLIISVDQEGGRVQRFRTGFLKLPPMAKLGLGYVDNPDLTLKQAYYLGWLMASELIHYGIDISFAPVLDLNYSRSSVIGDRAFADSAEVVYRLADKFIEGMESSGMAATAKHFPGHGYVEADSHLELPTDERSQHDIFSSDLLPFKQLIEQGKLSAIMPAHVVYPAVDENFTAGFSKIWLQKILRQSLGFSGLIFSDDLSMEGAAATGTPAVRAEKAKEAGCNVLLICNNRQAAQEIVDTVRDNRWPLITLHQMKSNRKIEGDLFASTEWQQALEIIKPLLAVNQ